MLLHIYIYNGEVFFFRFFSFSRKMTAFCNKIKYLELRQVYELTRRGLST